jgi:hypothetical protein
VNVVVATYNDEALEMCRSPHQGNRCICLVSTSGPLPLSVSPRITVPSLVSLMRRWLRSLGVTGIDAGRKVWTTDKNGTLERAFCQFIATLSPVFRSHYGREARKGQEDAYTQR